MSDHNYLINPLLGKQLTNSSNGSRSDSRIPGFKSYAIMLSLFGVGIAAAIFQHCFYSYINGRQIDDVPITQTWVIQAGNVFAFLFKATLVAAVGAAFCQRFWFSVRRQAIRVRTIDVIFGVLQNPVEFINTDFPRETKMLFAFAALSWILPLSAIFSPGALIGFAFAKAC
jgi:hypothetical protein